MQHSFDVLIAEKYGINLAIFINHLAFWIKKNQANRKHLHDGRYWTYNSIQSYSELFPYWSPKQMRLVLEKAKESGLVITGNYNLTPYDRTQWYAFSDQGHQLMGLSICPNGQIESNDRANGFVKKGQPIPDIKPDIKPDKRERAEKHAPRTLLSEDFEPDEETMDLFLDTTERCDIHPKDLKAKFFAVYTSSGKRSTDWNAELRLFLSREKPSNQKSNVTHIHSQNRQEPRSTVPEWGPGHPTWDRLHSGKQN